MQSPSPALIEWQRGWRTVFGITIGSGLGMPLFYYVFSLFTLDITKEFHITTGQLSNVQALLVVGALCAPFVGRLFDRRGFALIFTFSSLCVILAHVAMGSVVTTLAQFAVMTFVYGVAGVGCGPLAYTRPVTAWFWHSRGLALGVVGLGIALIAVVAPFLDRANPRAVAFAFTFVPALGFVLLGSVTLPAWAAIASVAMVGVQQGAEIDLFAWFISRRFGLARYGAVYGWIIASAWIGNAIGILGFGRLHDAVGRYALAELIAAGLFVIGACLLALVQTEPASDAAAPQ